MSLSSSSPSSASEKASDIFASDDSVGHGKDGQGGHTARPEFVGEVLAVGDDGGETDAQVLGYLLVELSLDDTRENFPFTWGQLGMRSGGCLRLSDNIGFDAFLTMGGMGHHHDAMDEGFLFLIDIEGVEALGQ